MQEMMFLFAEEWHWSKRDLIELTGSEILSLVKMLNRRRKAETEARKKAMDRIKKRKK